MAQKQNDFANDNAEQLSNQVKSAAGNAARKAGNATKKAVNKAAKKLMKAATRAVLRVVANLIRAMIHFIIAFLPYIIAGAIFIFFIWFICGYFTDSNYEEKAKLANYQTESGSQDNTTQLNPNTGEYEVTNYSDGNKIFKMFYGYNAQKGYWKVVVDKNGKPTSKLMRADDPKAQQIVDKDNREKDFIMNSDWLYLLDTNLNAEEGNNFYFPEQFTQPVYHDKNFNLMPLTDKNDNLIVKSTEYDKNGKVTKKKVPGVWDYGFGSILQYQKFKEQREKRATASNTYVWDYKNHVKVPQKLTGSKDSITENVDGYPRDVYMISKVTTPVGTIGNKIKTVWQQTNEPFTKIVNVKINGEKLVHYTKVVPKTNQQGQNLYYVSDPQKSQGTNVAETTVKTAWQVTTSVPATKWVPTKVTVQKTYKGYVWENVPTYDGEPDTSKLVGDEYIRAYLFHYTTYVPNNVMEKFDIKKRTGQNIKGLQGIFNQEQATENASSSYDQAPVQNNGSGSSSASTGTGSLNLAGNVSGSKVKYMNALKFQDLFNTYGKRYGVDPNLLLAICAQESGGNDNIDMSRYGRVGVGLMQIVSSTGSYGVTATNLETGQKETFHLDQASDFTAENSVRFAAMYLQVIGKEEHENVALTVRAYNSGGGAADNGVQAYAAAKGESADAVYADQGDRGWESYITLGDQQYLEHVFAYYTTSDGHKAYLIDTKGTKYSMDGTIQAGAAIVGNGVSDSGSNWFSSLIDAIKGHWNQLFSDSPTDALLHKDKYTFTKHTHNMTESEYNDLVKLFWSFANHEYYSQVPDQITSKDWIDKYKFLFENPTPQSPVDTQLLQALQNLTKLFPNGYGMPADKSTALSKQFDGTGIELKVTSGTAIQSMAAGRVTKASTIDHVVEIKASNGVLVQYSNLKNISVKVGEKVKQGTVLGKANGDLGLVITDPKGDRVDPSPIFVAAGDGSQAYNYQVVLQAIESVKGTPYAMVGNANDPSNGYVDCSGLMQWAFKKSGINLPRTADEQYNYVNHISASEAKPGDLVFFQHTYNAGYAITHVGLYIGNGQFWNANDAGVEISSLSNSYWASHDPVFGRVSN